MKSAYAKTKDKAEQSCYADESSATEYAANRIFYGADRIKDEGIHQFNKQGQKTVKETRENIGKAKDKISSYIVAGGWVAVVVIIVICLIALLAGSVFGIFFSGEDSGNGMTMQTVVREINTEYDTKLDEIKDSTSYDVLEMSGSRAVWKEVLAVYSVKTTTDPDNPQEVATMDEGKKQLLTRPCLKNAVSLCYFNKMAIAAM